MKQKFQVTGLLTSIVSAELIGALSALLSGNIGSGYQGLNQPPLSPPGWVFPVMWGILYALMGTAAYLVYQADAEENRKNRLWPFMGRSFFSIFCGALSFSGLKPTGFLWR